MKILSPDLSASDQTIELLAHSHPAIGAQVVDFESSSYDHIVNSTADLPTPVGGYIDLTSGSWIFASPVAIGTDTIRVPVGVTAFIYGAGWNNLLSGLADLFEVLGTALFNTLRMQTTGAGARCILLANAAANCAIVHCRMTSSNTGGIGLEIAAATQLNMFGGAFITCVVGCYVNGNITDIQLLGVTSRSIANAFLLYNAGATVAVNVSACCVTATNGISWAAASAPSRGMCIVSNDFNCSGAAFVGFTAASARINAKADIDTGGLMSETAIVP